MAIAFLRDITLDNVLISCEDSATVAINWLMSLLQVGATRTGSKVPGSRLTTISMQNLMQLISLRGILIAIISHYSAIKGLSKLNVIYHIHCMTYIQMKA